MVGAAVGTIGKRNGAGLFEIMVLTVFYSWQSDSPLKLNRNFIEDALKRALKQITGEAEVINSDRGAGVVLDKDTAGLPGTPPIVDAIFSKIDQCAVFVPDLTFVAKTDEGRPTPNANVLIEYGWALKSRGHQRIVPVMNDAFGEPSEKNLPFNMRHFRWPLRYTLPCGNDVNRSEVRRRLVSELAKAVRTVLERAPIETGSDAQPMPHTHNKAVFWEPRETLASNDGRDVSVLERGPKMFLRILPTSRIEEISTVRALKMARQGSLIPFRMARKTDGVLYARNQYGAIAYDLLEEKIEELSQLFESNELWGVSCRLQQLGSIPVSFESAFVHILAHYMAFSQTQLQSQLPLRLIAGIAGIRGLQIAAPPQGRFGGFERYGGKAVKPDIDFETHIFHWSSPSHILLPFFEKVWDAFGLERSHYYDWLQYY